MGSLASVAFLIVAVAAAAPQAVPRSDTATEPRKSLLALEVDREEARQQYRAGDQFMAREAFDEAAARFRRAIQLDPDYVLAYYSLGQALMKLRHYEEAVTAYTDCRETLVRQSHLDQKSRGELDRQRQDEIHNLEDSLQKVQAGKAGRMYGASALSLEVGIQDRLKMLRDAEHRGAVGEVTIPAELHLALGSAYFRLNQLEPAEESFRDAIQRRGNLGAAHNNLAVICMMTGRYEEARQEIRAAEHAGFFVSGRFKADLEERERQARLDP